MNDTDREVFRAFVAARGTTLVRTAYLLTGDWQHAEDVVQTALARTYASWWRLRDHDKLEGYVRRSVTRSCVNLWRQGPRRREVVTDILPERTVPGPGAATQGSGPLWQALLDLPPRQRAVVVLRFYEDLAEADIARQLGCSVGTVKSQLSRALARLRGQGRAAFALEGDAS